MNEVGVNFEGRGQDSVLDARGEDVTRQGDGTGIGAAERRISEGGGVVAEVDLVVDDSFGEDENVEFLQHFGVELVGGVDEADVELPCEHGEHLRAPRVRVERVDASGAVLHQRGGDPEACQGRERFGVHPLDGVFCWGCQACSVAQHGGGEVVARDGTLVGSLGQEEVAGELRVGRTGGEQ